MLIYLIIKPNRLHISRCPPSLIPLPTQPAPYLEVIAFSVTVYGAVDLYLFDSSTPPFSIRCLSLSCDASLGISRPADHCTALVRTTAFFCLAGRRPHVSGGATPPFRVPPPRAVDRCDIDIYSLRFYRSFIHRRGRTWAADEEDGGGAGGVGGAKVTNAGKVVIVQPSATQQRFILAGKPKQWAQTTEAESFVQGRRTGDRITAYTKDVYKNFRLAL